MVKESTTPQECVGLLQNTLEKNYQNITSWSEYNLNTTAGGFDQNIDIRKFRRAKSNRQ